MAAMLSITAPDPLPKKGNLSDNWRKWKQNFDIYLGAASIHPNSSKASSLFLHSIGQYGRDIFNELDISEPYELQDIYIKFDEHCNPKKNLTFERYTFFNTKQEPNQTFDKFYLLLKQRSISCKFGELANSLISTQIIIGMNNAELRKHLLIMPDLTLNDIVEKCKAAESAKVHAQKIEAATASAKTKNKCPAVKIGEVNKLAQELHQSLKLSNEISKTKNQQKPATVTNCKFCSGSHKYGDCPSKSSIPFDCKFCGKNHIKGNCPAFGSTCYKCKNPNHFAKYCRA